MLKEPVLTMPSSRLQPSERVYWKYRSASSTLFVVIAASLSRVQGIASERKQPWLPLVLTDIPLLIGVVGYLVAMSNVHDAVATVDPAMRAMLTERGQQEAMKNIYLGAGMMVLLTIQYVVMVLLKPRPSS